MTGETLIMTNLVFLYTVAIFDFDNLSIPKIESAVAEKMKNICEKVQSQLQCRVNHKYIEINKQKDLDKYIAKFVITISGPYSQVLKSKRALIKDNPSQVLINIISSL